MADRYACISNNTILKIVTTIGQPADIPHKGISFLPYVEETVNTSTGPNTVTVVDNAVIEPTRVYKKTTIRDMTPAEVTAKNEAAKTEAIAKLQQTNDILKALGEVVFELVNKDRQRDGQNPLTATQFRNYVKSKL